MTDNILKSRPLQKERRQTASRKTLLTKGAPVSNFYAGKDQQINNLEQGELFLLDSIPKTHTLLFQ